jgi:uncharacterized protein YdhG (YjbR/CyaY superfamily)
MPAARTVDEYLASLPEDHRQVVAALREVVLRNLPAGFQESMTWGVPTYEVPLARYPDTYNGKPLGFAAVAARKNYFTLHLVHVYADPAVAAALREGFARRGRRLDMGKGCVRFKRLEDLPLDVIADIIAGTSLDDYVARIEAGQRQRTAARKAAKPAEQTAARKATKTVRKTSAGKAVKSGRPTAARKATKSARKPSSRKAAKPALKSSASHASRRRR